MAAPARAASPGPTSGPAQCGADGGSVWRRSGARTAAGGGSSRRQAARAAGGCPSPALRCAPEPAAMAAAPAPGAVIVLDDEEDGGSPPAAGGPQPNGAAGPPPAASKTAGAYKAENERLFAEFLDLCTRLTEEHPEVIPFLSGRHQKASADFLASAELRNVLSRCLSRVRARRNKVYVYINELCTVLKAHTLRRKLPLAPAPPAASPQPAPEPPPPPPSETSGRPSGSGSGGGSKRQIRYLENLLRVYTGEIRRLQERELDLAELDSEDSTYLQESRLKRKMMRIFQRLCELKQCSSLTGRVIEQRIAYRGTRYPEVNRRIERFINRPEVFPDYTDILKVIQKASARHSLGLARRQMESMAQDAFREVGNRLQERRHLDLVYNFGSHLTDQYRPGTDPALLDPELAKRLRKNRTVALTRLDDVISRYAQLQDESEEEERGRKRAARQQAAAAAGSPSAAAAAAPPVPPPEGRDGDDEEDDDEEEEDSEDDEEEEEEEEEDDDDSSDVETEPGRAGPEEEEEREEDDAAEAAARGDAGARQPPLQPPSAAARDPRGDRERRPTREEEEEEEEETKAKDAAGGQSPAHELFVLEIETLPLEPGETPPPSPQALPDGSEATPKAAPCTPEPSEATPLAPPSPEAVSSRTVTAPQEPEKAGERRALWTRPAAKRKRPPGSPRPLENGAGGTISSTSFNGSAASLARKRSRPELPAGPCIEVHGAGSEDDDDEEEEEEEEEAEGASGLPTLRHSPLPDSTRADSPGQGLVSSSQGSPRRLLPKACKTSVATQCDPEEIIVLSDSD